MGGVCPPRSFTATTLVLDSACWCGVAVTGKIFLGAASGITMSKSISISHAVAAAMKLILGSKNVALCAIERSYDTEI